jgi:hypothetical protein
VMVGLDAIVCIGHGLVISRPPSEEPLTSSHQQASLSTSTPDEKHPNRTEIFIMVRLVRVMALAGGGRMSTTPPTVSRAEETPSLGVAPGLTPGDLSSDLRLQNPSRNRQKRMVQTVNHNPDGGQQ